MISAQRAGKRLKQCGDQDDWPDGLRHTEPVLCDYGGGMRKSGEMKNGYLLLLCNSLGATMEVSYLEKFSGQRVDAIIQIGGKVDELVSDTSYVENINRVANTTPILITGKLDGADCYQVNIDEGQSMELLMQFLIENGHQDIALMGGRDNVKSTLDKRLRYRQMLRKYGIPVREEYIVDGSSYDIESGSAAMYRFIREDHPMPSAIIAIMTSRR